MKTPISLSANLYEFLEIQAKKMGHKKFLRFHDQKISFQEIFHQIKSFAAYLQSLCLPKGFKIGILSKNRPEVIIAYFAAAIARGTAIPLNYFHSHDEIEYIVINSSMEIFIFSGEFQKAFAHLFPKKTDIKHYLCLDVLNNPKVKNFETLKNIYLPSAFQLPKLNSDDIAAILYTSGTTGNPKGVMLSHLNLISDAVYLAEDFKPSIKGKIRYVQFLPLFHSFSFMAGILCMWHLGASVSLLETVLPFEKVIKTILKHRINLLIGIPQLYRVLSEKAVPSWMKFFLKRLFPIKLCISGGAPLPLTVLENFNKKYAISIFQGYGLTEASPIVSVNNKYRNRPGSVGIPPKELLEVRILDEEGKILPPEEAGEIVLKGKSIMAGYYRNPQATQEAIQEGWLFTGDIGKIDLDGFLYIMDRKKDLIIFKGMNVYPVEVEETLLKHPAVKEVAVVGIPDEHHGEIPIAIIEKTPGQEATTQELKKFCQNHEASYKIPKFFEFWETLPRNSTGKILKREIRRILLEKNKKKT